MPTPDYIERPEASAGHSEQVLPALTGAARVGLGLLEEQGRWTQEDGTLLIVWTANGSQLHRLSREDIPRLSAKAGECIPSATAIYGAAIAMPYAMVLVLQDGSELAPKPVWTYEDVLVVPVDVKGAWDARLIRRDHDGRIGEDVFVYRDAHGRAVDRLVHDMVVSLYLGVAMPLLSALCLAVGGPVPSTNIAEAFGRKEPAVSWPPKLW